MSEHPHVVMPPLGPGIGVQRMVAVPGDVRAQPAKGADDRRGADTADLNGPARVRRVLRKLDRDLVAMHGVKARIAEIAASLVVDRWRRAAGLDAGRPTLHASFTGNPGTGKTTVAMRMGAILRELGYVRTGHVVAVTRDDLVGRYIGHTAPKTHEVLKRAMGGVLFIDEAYGLFRADNERDYGQEVVELLLQVMENRRDDLVVIMAGYADRMERFFDDVPGLASRLAHHLDFPDYTLDELMQIAHAMLRAQGYRLSADAEPALREHLGSRMGQPRFANGRSVRNALDRARLRQAIRLCEAAERGRRPTRADLAAIQAQDIRGVRLHARQSSGGER